MKQAQRSNLVSRTTILLVAVTPCAWQPGPSAQAILIAALGFVAFIGLELAAHRRAA